MLSYSQMVALAVTRVGPVLLMFCKILMVQLFPKAEST